MGKESTHKAEDQAAHINAGMGNHNFQQEVNANTQANVYTAQQKQMEDGPRLDFDTDANGQVDHITISGEIVLFSAGESRQEQLIREKAQEHFKDGIKDWNQGHRATMREDEDPRIPFYENWHKARKSGHVVFNGRLVGVDFNMTVRTATLAEVQGELQQPALDVVYILVSSDEQSDYPNLNAIDNRPFQNTPQTQAYNQQTGATYNNLVNAPANMLAIPPLTAATINATTPIRRTSFIVGNIGYYDMPMAENRGNSVASHELGHWLGYYFLGGGAPNTHRTDGYTEGGHLSTMANQSNSVDRWSDRKVLNRDILDFSFANINQQIAMARANANLTVPPLNINAGIGRATDFNVYQPSPGGTQNHLGDRLPNGQLLLFNNNDLFSNSTEAMIFANYFASFPDWMPGTGVAPQ